jgi:ubiquinone/menaquinone biosynthesis C-methylase UbiE
MEFARYAECSEEFEKARGAIITAETRIQDPYRGESFEVSMLASYVDPYTHTPLSKDSAGNLRCGSEGLISYRSREGCYDFVRPDPETQKERDHYDEEYSKKDVECISADTLKAQWFDEMTPWRQTLLESLGDIDGKNILLIGNGETTKELFFSIVGANVVFTDLSIEAVTRIKKQVEISGFSNRFIGSIEFHAVDALHLPFPNDSFDIIYGAAFVHHVGDLDQFFNEVRRCLKVNGICRFIDQADSPIWRIMNRTILWPLKKYSYWRSPRSPGDLEADRRGGYTKDGLNSLMKTHGFHGLFFKREWFFFRIVSRHYGKFFNYDPTAMARGKTLFRCMKWLDTKLMNTWFMSTNGLMLTWGFTKS